MPYLFNGKELDSETGLYYYGARYYDPRTSIWLNVDPLAEKTMTPYAYVNNNPINLIDPTGMEGEDPPAFHDFIEGTQWIDDTGRYIWTKTSDGREMVWWNVDTQESSYGIVDLSGEYSNGKAILPKDRKGLSDYAVSFVKDPSGPVFSFIDEVWNNDLSRIIISDTYSIGLTSNVAAFLGVGTTPINFTLLTRGEEPGLYFTPTINAAIGTGIEGNAGITFSRGIYTGNPRAIKAVMLQGHTFGISAGLGFVGDGAVGVSYARTENGNGFISISGQIGLGIEGSPVTGVNAQVNYQYTPIVKPIFKFK